MPTHDTFRCIAAVNNSRTDTWASGLASLTGLYQAEPNTGPVLLYDGGPSRYMMWQSSFEESDKLKVCIKGYIFSYSILSIYSNTWKEKIE